MNEAEIEIMESELEHQKMTYFFNESEQKVKKLQREFKRAISKSRWVFAKKLQKKTVISHPFIVSVIAFFANVHYLLSFLSLRV